MYKNLQTGNFPLRNPLNIVIINKCGLLKAPKTVAKICYSMTLSQKKERTILKYTKREFEKLLKDKLMSECNVTLDTASS